jgi:thiol-disulfide isomerase/thioredoxin
MSRREWLVVVAVAVLAVAAGIGVQYWRISGTPGDAANEALQAARFTDLQGETQSVERWRGKVIVVNFWATWCAPCREEIPMFVKLQEKYGERGLQFVGVAIDQPAKVRPFASEFGMNFPVLIGGADAIELTRSLGNKASVLPFTVILGRDGRITATETGAVKEGRFESFLATLL